MTAAALLAVFSFTALQDLTGLLKGMHGDGEPSYGMQDLPRLLHPGPDTKHTDGVLEVWFGFADVAGTATPLTVTGWYVAVDTTFAIAYLVWLLLWLRGSRVMFEHWKSDPSAAPVALRTFFTRRGLTIDRDLAPYIRAATWVPALVLLALLVEALESLATLELVEPLAERDGQRFWSIVLWFVVWAKWAVVLLLVGIALAAGWIRAIARLGILAGVGWTILRLRVHVALVLVLAGILLVHEQIPDVIRRWEAEQLGWAVGFAAGLALATWAVSRRLLLAGPTTRLRTVGRRRSGLVVAALALAAVVFVAVDLSTPANVGWGLALPAGLAAVVFALNFFFARAGATVGDVALQRPPRATSVVPRLLASSILVIVALAILRASFGYAVYVREWEWAWAWLILPPALALLAAGRPGGATAPTLRREPLVWGALGAGLAYLIIRLTTSGELHQTTLVGSALLLGLAAWRLYPALEEVDGRGAFSWWVLGVPAVAVGAVWLGVVIVPFAVGEYLGGVAVIAAFLLAVCLIGGALVWVGDTVEVPAALRFFQLRRWPVLTLLVLWFVTGSLLDKGDFHNVRSTPASQGLAPSTTAAAARPASTLQGAFDCWLVKNGLRAPDEECPSPQGATTEPRPVTPLFLVSTSGGGIRAAYWTALTLDCAFELVPGKEAGACPQRRRTAGSWRSNTLFAGSGVSGGSLGLASYAAYLATKTAPASGNGWVDERLRPDALSASMGWWLFVEFPRSFLRFDGGTDRAEILERGWERAWGGLASRTLAMGIFEFAAATPQAPLLLLNATSVEDGCRFNASVLDANVEGAERQRRYDCRASDPFDDGEVASSSALGATRDLADFLCRTDEPEARHDIPLSSAALLSGRFPFVSPSGRLERRCGAEGEVPVTYVVDGGYLEPTGAGTILDLAEALEPILAKHNAANPEQCVVPYLIQIDNGATSAAPSAPSRPQELLVPLQTLLATRGARGADARADTGFQFSQHPREASVGADDRYVHFRNKAHPGPQAPLGWTLSGHSREDLLKQLALNADEFAAVRRILEASRAGELSSGC